MSAKGGGEHWGDEGTPKAVCNSSCPMIVSWISSERSRHENRECNRSLSSTSLLLGDLLIEWANVCRLQAHAFVDTPSESNLWWMFDSMLRSAQPGCVRRLPEVTRRFSRNLETTSFKSSWIVHERVTRLYGEYRCSAGGMQCGVAVCL